MIINTLRNVKSMKNFAYQKFGIHKLPKWTKPKIYINNTYICIMYIQ